MLCVDKALNKITLYGEHNMSKISKKCVEFVNSMNKNTISRIIAQKSKYAKENHLEQLSIPKSYLPEIIQVAHKYGIEKEITNKHLNRQNSPNNTLQKTTLQKLQEDLKEDTYNQVTSLLYSIFDAQSCNVELDLKISFYKKKRFEWSRGRYPCSRYFCLHLTLLPNFRQ